MKKALIFLLCTIVVPAAAQLVSKWEQVYGGNGIEYGYSTRSCPGQGYVAAGTSSTGGITDGLVVRTDTLGLVMWMKYYVGNNVDVLRSIRPLPDSGFIMAGYSNSGGHGGYDGWLLRTDKNGDTLWTKYIGTSDWDFFYDVYPVWDGGFILAGGTYGQGAGDEDMYFVRTDANGDTLWTRTYGGALEDEARSVIQTGDSLLAACGYSKSLGDTLGDAWILRLDENGDTLWNRTFANAASEDKAFGIADMFPYPRLYVAGEQMINGTTAGMVYCFNYGGTQLFSSQFDGPDNDNLYGIATRPSDVSFAAVGTTFSFGGGNGDMGFFSDLAGATTFGTLQEDMGFGIDNTPGKGYIVCGYTKGYNSVLPNLYLVKVDSAGQSTGVLFVREHAATGAPAATRVFPNPATEDATVTIDAVQSFSGALTMAIFDVSGRKLMDIPFSSWQLLNDRSASCRVNVSMLEAGVYTYVISDGSSSRCAGRFVKQ